MVSTESLMSADHLAPWMMGWCHESFRGGVPEGDVKDLTVEMGMDVEAAALAGEPLWGLNEDTKKYFDTIVREIIWAAAQDLDLPEWFADPQRRFYNDLQRMFKYGKALGPLHTTIVSVFQGCALSQIWANVCGSCWAWAATTFVTPYCSNFTLACGVRVRS